MACGLLLIRDASGVALRLHWNDRRFRLPTASASAMSLLHATPLITDDDRDFRETVAGVLSRSGLRDSAGG